MKYYLTLLVMTLSFNLFSQVGIETKNTFAMLTVNGSTAFIVAQLSDFPTTATVDIETVDNHTSLNITQNTANVNLTLPPPTNLTRGRMLTVTNSGTVPFTMNGVVIEPDTGKLHQWSGMKWFHF